MAGSGANSTAPSEDAFQVTPSDDTTFIGAQVPRGLWIGGAGNLAVVMANGDSTITIVGVAAGSLLPVRVKKVMAATTATNIVALL